MSNHTDNAGPSSLTLISHALCPYVQRVAILLAEKGMSFERVNIDLANKPQWFLDMSPLGKTPVLQVGAHRLFESAVICEYLDETVLPALHPADALHRAQHRAWMEFGSQVLNGIAALYAAPTESTLRAKAADLRQRFEQLEAQLSARDGSGPYFAGQNFSMVDVVFGPVFRYFDVIDPCVDLGLFEGLPRLASWRLALSQRDSVRQAVSPEYPGLLKSFLLEKPSALAKHLA